MLGVESDASVGEHLVHGIAGQHFGSGSREDLAVAGEQMLLSDKDTRGMSLSDVRKMIQQVDA